MSARTGASVEALSELGYAAQQSGTSAASLEGGLKHMQRTLADAAGGSETSAEALGNLGLTVADLQGLSPDQQFERIAEGLAGIQDPAARAAASMKIFGRSGTELLGLTAGGAAGIRALRMEAQELGLTWTTETATGAEQLGDAMSTLWSVIKRVRDAIGEALMPALLGVSKPITLIVVGIGKFIRETQRLVLVATGMAGAIVAVGAAITGIGGLFVATGFAISGFLTAASAVASVVGGIGTVLGIVVGPIGLAVAAVGALTAAFLTFTETGQAITSTILNTFSSMKATVTDTFGGIADALKGGDFALAADIAWAGVKLAFEQGVDPLRGIWIDFSTWFQKIGLRAFHAVRVGWMNVANWFRSNFPNFTATISSLWTDVWAGMAKTLARFQGWVADVWAEVLGLFDDEIDVKAVQQANREDVDAEVADIERGRQASQQENLTKLGMSPAELDAELAKETAAAEADLQKALAATDENRLDRIQKARNELTALQNEFNELRETAAGKRTFAELSPEALLALGSINNNPKLIAEAMTRFGKKIGGSIGGIPLDDITNRINTDIEAQSTGRSIGTFQTAAFDRMFGGGGGGGLDGIEDNTKETAKQVKRLADLANRGRLVFG
ncbi:MAG: hypothetical protein IT348_19350 [Candidatus Eisenbacteria bacterium]|nr:hypothetical protein [Candidatus Eisenbacteria bacterium]